MVLIVTKYSVNITLLNIKSCPLQHIGQPYSSQKREAEKERREDVIRGKTQTTQHNTSPHCTLNAVITFRNIYCHSVCDSPP
jgi:hypothetical protein